ncbi:hypothetical protein D1007_43595 [Hordeum vulgare]|nr:hypothetical protein D1007_43595 [Hordeum vulgare]
MRVNSEKCWVAYKDTVAESLDKALELFAIKTNIPNLHLDLNWVASPIGEASPPRINEEANIEPLLEDNDEHDDDENDGTVLHDNNLGDLDKFNLQEIMDHSIPYSRGYASESDDEGPDEVLDEEGFTAKEAEAFTKSIMEYNYGPTRSGRLSNGEDERQSVLEETWMDGAMVVAEKWGTTNSKSLLRDHIVESMAASQTNKATMKWGGEKDVVGEDQRLWERAAKKLREEGTSKALKKKE